MAATRHLGFLTVRDEQVRQGIATLSDVIDLEEVGSLLHSAGREVTYVWTPVTNLSVGWSSFAQL